MKIHHLCAKKRGLPSVTYAFRIFNETFIVSQVRSDLHTCAYKLCARLWYEYKGKKAVHT